MVKLNIIIIETSNEQKLYINCVLNLLKKKLFNNLQQFRGLDY